MAWQTWLIYLAAVVGLSLTPGPNGMLALTHGALYGYRKALYTISGGITGFIFLIALSMLGIGTLLQASSNVLTILKWIGGAYLVWLGWQLWRSPVLPLAAVGQPHHLTGLILFRQGLLSAVSNPKVLLFYGAFLPQFIAPGRDLLPQFFVMAASFAVIEFLVESMLARLAHHIRPRLARGGRRFNQLCGGLFAVMGTALPMTC